jgi:hypothetical protein
MNNNNFYNQQSTLFPKNDPAWNINSQHRVYHHNGPVHDVSQQTASHTSAWQNVILTLKQAIMSQRGSRSLTATYFGDIKIFKI